ncbi:HNH endonuclease signature motif containing protein [Aeromicrobium duanguangcaii]|uniref:HNH endonuclease signature motif containing protein n=1 Tax=Aeromicrobium duanguangcaii TaxID=2968086 RepID=UPI002017F74A|nr:HNH endonuclease signature motif containing protein [Aeromicrobium duanguangcaii]MCL3839159.1 HNH endonuclease [Aeromicrobium duanguangcaii]
MSPNRIAVACDAARRRRAIADFEEWSLIVGHHDRQTAEIDRTDDLVLSKELARREVVLELAQALHVTERTIWAIVFESRTLRERTPAVWEAFRAGDLDAARVSAIADCAERLQTRAAWTMLEHSAPEYAATHTVSELRSWLRRLRARLEPEETKTETVKAVEDRRVSITHNDDGTSWLNALLPTGVAIAVGARLRKAAKALPSIDPETDEKDRRTRDQKMADLLAHWLTCSEGTATDIRAEIAISIAATDLIGLTDGPGLTLDGEPVGSEWVRELAQSEHAVLRRLVLDPIGQVLDTTVLSYRPPQSLRQALRWRDGTCRVAGCRAPVHETDQDHAIDYDSGGDTSASNLRCLCRKHHNMKSHGHLDDRYLDPPRRYVERYLPCPPIVTVIDMVDPARLIA